MGRGAASNADTPPAHSAISQALHRATQPNYFDWLEHVRAASGCTRPIRLTGEIYTIQRLGPDAAVVLDQRSTEQMPDAVIYKPCGNRRQTVCPSCARTYQHDAYQLLRAGLAGGKGIPDTVARHPAVFATFTAPSFGPVHTRRTSRQGAVLACRPRREPELCPHGVDLRCHRLHDDSDPVLGVPLCLDCYDHHHQVVWNNHAPELWRRTRIALERHLGRVARSLGIDPKAVRLRYAKVAEMQRRGVVHFHAVIRLDGHNPDNPELIVPPPSGLTAEHLTDAITTAARQTTFTTEAHPANPHGWPIAWGEQLDARPIRLAGDGQLTDAMAAGYLAKYATKATEATGHTSHRLTAEIIDLYADPDGTHPERLIDACWTLGQHWPALRRWAHMLGFGGHFLTKARRYSTTFKFLRETRTAYRRHQDQEQSGTVRAVDHTSEETTLIVGLLTFAGAGWRTNGDALLANTAAALARARRQVAREELAHKQSRVLAAA